MKVCVVSFKECWRGASGQWLTDGGFPRQMAAIASLFDEMVLAIAEVPPREGGGPLPATARVVPLPNPAGVDARRKLSILCRLPAYVSRIAAEVRDADAVHVPLPGDLPFIGMVLAQLLHKPLLARYGSSWPVNRETTAMNRVTKRWMQLAAGGRNVMVATGDGTAPPAPGVHWLFASAVSGDEIARLSTTVSRGIGSPPRLIYAGRLAPEKGVDVLIRAMAILQDRTSATLTIAGDGPDRRMLQAEASRLVRPGRVAFLGQLDRDRLSQCLASSDVCVHPSHTESLCKAWLDAMAHGLPVVACDIGSARSAIGEQGERGVVVPPAQPAAFAEAVQQLIEAPRDWPALRQRCHEYVRTRTLEAWAAHLGGLCASQWGLTLVDGKLRRCA